jgi:hypothetical protein
MSFLDFNFDDVVEPRTVDPDREYKLRITDVRSGTDKNGNPYYMPRFEILDEVGAKSFTYFLGLPNDSMDAKRLNSVKYKIKTFLDAFGLPYDGDPENDWAGAEGWAILGVEENDQYGPQNVIKKFVKG